LFAKKKFKKSHCLRAGRPFFPIYPRPGFRELLNYITAKHMSLFKTCVKCRPSGLKGWFPCYTRVSFVHPSPNTEQIRPSARPQLLPRSLPRPPSAPTHYLPAPPMLRPTNTAGRLGAIYHKLYAHVHAPPHCCPVQVVEPAEQELMGRLQRPGQPSVVPRWGAIDVDLEPVAKSAWVPAYLVLFDLICNAQRRVSARLPVRPLHPGTKGQPAA
jgi:hypothetical protein